MSKAGPIVGYSRAMFSNWCWHQPLQLVIDAGEGMQLALGHHIWSPEVVALTHGHSDHLLGLPGFIASRRFAKGAQEKPLTVVYPDGNTAVTTVREMVRNLWPREEFPVTWVPLKAGEEHRLAPTRVLQPFRAAHGGGEPAHGYRVLEERRRLKPAFSALSQEEIRARVAAEGRDGLMEPYRHVVFAHTGDSMPIDPAIVRHADILVHDATFLIEEDRRDRIHATTAEAIAVGREAGVRTLVLQHLSVRYERDEAVPALKKQVRELGFEGECWLLDGGNLAKLSAAGRP
jgi:ribonuclease Z